MPGNSFKDRELAKRARAKSVKGPHKKTKAWEALGEYITGHLTDRVLNYIADQSDEEAFKSYLMLLEYFKPKLSRSEIKAEVNPISEKIKTVYDAIQQESDISEPEPSNGQAGGGA